jgi:hypothetical protein
LYRAQTFPQVVFLRVAMEWPLDDEDVLSPILEYRLKRAITFDPTVGSRLKFSRGYFTCGSYGMLLGDDDVWSPVLGYRLKYAITFDPTVGSRSNFYRGCFPWGSYRMATRCPRCLVDRS